MVEMWRWITGGGGGCHFSALFYSSPSKSKLTVVSYFLLFILVVAASIFAFSRLPLNADPSASSSPLSRFFSLPADSSLSAPPPASPSPREDAAVSEGLADPLLANRGVSSENENGGANSSFSLEKGHLSPEMPFQGLDSATVNSTKNSTLVLATDKNNDGNSSGELVRVKSIPPEAAPSNRTTGCGGNGKGKGTCFEGRISEKSGTEEQDLQITHQQPDEKNRTDGEKISGLVVKTPPPPPPPPNAAATIPVVADAAALIRNESSPPAEVKAQSGLSAECDIFDGRWVWDEGIEPFYPPGSCPYIDDDFNCHKNGRPDTQFLKWRWKPYGCDVPRLNATDFLRRLRGQRLVFVGDSLNRNMWESLVCILRNSISNKNRVHEASGRKQFKIKGRKRFKVKGHYSFIFADYDCSIDFVRSTFLVKEVLYNNANGSDYERLRLDILDETVAAYHGADVIVFNTGHWWTHEKTARGKDYYQEGNHVYPVLKVMEAYKKALTTWARWIDKNIDSRKTQVVFRGYSPTHFRGGQWNSGGQCHKETEPIFNQTFLSKYPSKMRALEYVLKQMKTPVLYLNISRLTDYRKDGHPSIYRKRYESVEEQIAAEKSQDCSHWCLPGVPDSWNELLYASLLVAGKGSWGRQK
ncbi:protein trichome birefringence-like 2 [Zingiber officinale]|uniref:protein trichome birefringence-like 2 n=1 Tax=Zingiber officinale TaxID=94328 RepID=UPI001C4A7A4E|nr:protein trichome birefringence-like 2 [Zingiber officinale]